MAPASRLGTTCPPEIAGTVRGEIWVRNEVRPRDFPFGIRQLETIIVRNTSRVQMRTSSASIRLGNGDGNGTAATAESSLLSSRTPRRVGTLLASAVVKLAIDWKGQPPLLRWP